MYTSQGAEKDYVNDIYTGPITRDCKTHWNIKNLMFIYLYFHQEKLKTYLKIMVTRPLTQPSHTNLVQYNLVVFQKKISDLL